MTNGVTLTKALAKLLLPPIVVRCIRLIRSRLPRPTDTRVLGVDDRPPPHAQTLDYLPDPGAAKCSVNASRGWNADDIVNFRLAELTLCREYCQDTNPLGLSREDRNVVLHNNHLTFAYVLALAARQKSVVSVLDWGGALGHYYYIGRAALPEIELDYHCYELPVLAKSGRQVNPDVHWHSDDRYLGQSYDLVMLNGAMQYVEDWRGLIARVTPLARIYFFLTRLPVVEKSPSFVAVQRTHGAEMLHYQLNQDEVLEAVRSTGLRLRREFVIGERPYIANAPEQCELRGWLFQR